MSISTIPVRYNGVTIHQDEEHRVSMTDLWRAAGSPKDKRPVDWLALPSSLGFMAAACRLLKVEKSHLLKIQKGRHGATFAHPLISLEYSQAVDHDLSVVVNHSFLERQAEEKNPDLTVNRAIRNYQEKGYTDGQIRARLLGITTRKDFVSVLARHGVHKHGYRLCTNATYEPLWGGPAAHIRVRKNLPEKANTREHMSEKELVGLHLAELLAAESIETTRARGNEQCATQCRRAAQSVAQMIVAHQEGNRPR
jgi:hypothetical protein